MGSKSKQIEQLPLEDLPEPIPSWKISERTKRIGKYWLPIVRKKLNYKE